ncbi:unnamed protein product [Lepidochelys kempii]
MEGYILFPRLAMCLTGTAVSGIVPINTWLALAQSAVNATLFCLPHTFSVGAIMETCFIGVCAAPTLVQHYSLLKTINKTFTYTDLYTLGSAQYKLDASMFSYYLANTTLAPSCMRFVNATHIGKNLTNKELKCNNSVEISFAYGYMKLPAGWFLICGRHAYSYVPANSSGGPCSLDRVAPLIFSYPPQLSARHKRDAIPLDSTCRSEVTLFSESEAAVLAFSLVGIPGLVVHNYHAVEHLACTVAKAINLTSTVLAQLSHELGKVCQGMLQNRLAVNYLLLCHGHLCQEFAGMCCFNITDAAPSVEADLQHLKQLVKGIHQQTGEDWLGSLFSGWGLSPWLSGLFSLLFKIFSPCINHVMFTVLYVVLCKNAYFA